MSTISFLAEWAVRSSLLILAGAVVLLVLRVKDSSIRLAAWVALLCGSAMLPLMTVSLPAVPVPVAVVRPVAGSVVFFDLTPNTPLSAGGAVAKLRPALDRARAALIVYFAITLVLILRVVVGLAMSWRLQRGSRETGVSGVWESDDVVAPVTLGIFRPVIVLPVGWREWDEAKLTAGLAHERSHIARFDPAVQLLSAVHRAVLWFSPASWFLHSRIVRIAEEASDDAAIAVTRDRASYAEFLLEFMRLKECGAGVPMARYGAPEKRIHRILNGKSLSRGVTRWSAAAIVMLGVPLAYLAASVRSAELPARAKAVVRASIPEGLPFVPQFVAQVQAPVMPKPPAAPDAKRPKFDVASVRPCDPNYVPPGGRGGGRGATDRFRLNCVTAMSLISNAYIRFADGQGRGLMAPMMTRIEGGPAWLDTDQYTIEAEAGGPATVPVMAGPMMQVLLEDRFQLKVHRETREGPVYNLILAKSGASKTLATKGTPCTAADFVNAPVPFRPGDDRPCQMTWIDRKGPNVAVTLRGVGMEAVTQSLTGFAGRLVIDKTGITGNIDLDLVFTPEDDAPLRGVAPTEPTAEDPAGPSIFTVLEHVGLKLESAKGPREFLVIDSVSRPSEN